MRRRICQLANLLLKPFKINAITQKEFVATLRLQEQLIALYNARRIWEEDTTANVACLVFSKDRAMQLHAFLTSFFQKVSPHLTVHILFHTSSQDHEKSYRDLKEYFQDLPVYFHRQDNATSFKKDLLAILSGLHESKILFFVDDIIVTEETDINDLLQFDTDLFVPSLRLGLNLTTSYTTQREQPLPTLHPNLVRDQDKIAWQWQDGILDWGYPLSLDGHLFRRQEMLAMLQLLPFSAPNSLEDALQCFKPLFASRFGVAYKKSKIMNLPCNRVQTENKNLSGNIHQDDLLRQWNNGYVIDLSLFDKFTNTSAHQEIAIRFQKRPTPPKREGSKK